MQRLLGTHVKKARLPEGEGDGDDSRSHCKADTLLFLIRAVCLLAALCVSVALPVILRALVGSQQGKCPYAMSIGDQPARTRDSAGGAALPVLAYNGSTALHCMFPMYNGVAGAILAFVLLAVCLHNLRHATFR